MTIANTVVKQLYTGDGVTDTFAIPFAFQSNTEVKVLLRNENVSPATETLQTISTHYTLDNNPAVNVVMITPPAAGEFLLIYRATTLTQPVDYVETGTFPAESHEDALDKLTQQAQEIKESVDRAFKMPISSSGVNVTFPEPEASYLLGWNGAGDALETIDPASLTLIGVGDVIGPVSATNNGVVRFNSVTGKLIKNSGVIIDDSNVVTGITQLNVDNLRIDNNALTSTNLNGNIEITPSGTGNLVLDGLNWPQADGAGGTFLTTNGTGQLSWSAGAAGDISGPGAATTTAIAVWGDVGGVTLLNSGVLIDGSDNMSGVNQLDVANINIQSNTISSSDTNGNLILTPNGTGNLVLDGLNWPQADGLAGQALHTNGLGQAYWDTALTGDVVGPASAVDNEIPRYDGITGKLIQGSGAIINDAGILSGLNEAFIGELHLDNSYITPSTPGATLDLLGNAPTSYVRIEGVRWPKADGASGQVLTTDGAGFTSWATPAGGGDVLSPGASTDNAIVRFDGLTGTLLQDSVVLIDDVGVVSGVTQINIDNIRIDGNTISSTDVNGDLILTPNGTGDLVLDGLNWPQADGTVGQVLTTNGAGQTSWATVAGAGDVVGPASATDEALVRFDLTTGKLIQNSVGILTDAGALSGLTQLNVDNIQVDANTISSTDVNGNLILTPNGTGNLVLDGVNWPQADGTVGQILSTNGTGQTSWIANSVGDVVGPASATDDAIVKYDGTTGKLIQNSVGILTDAGALSGLTQLDVDNIGIDGNTIISTDVDGNIQITPNGNGDIVLDGVNWPQADGTAGQVLTTDGLGQLSWGAGGGGGGSVEITVTAGENLLDGDAVYISVGNANGDTGRTEGSAYKLDPTNDNRMEFVGFANAAIASAATGPVLVAGEIDALSGLTIGEPFYASVTVPGGVQVTAPTADTQWIIQLGVATSTTTGTINAASSATAIKIDTSGGGGGGGGVGAGGVETAKTANYIVVSDDNATVIPVDTTSNIVTITLPAPSAGFIITIKDIARTSSVNFISIARNGSELIDGVASNDIINEDGKAVTLISDGTNWFRISSFSGSVTTSGNIGLFGGGLESGATPSNVIQFIIIETTGNSTDFGDLTQARTSISAFASSERGVFCGGNDNGATNYNTLDYVTIASVGNATDFGDLNAATREAAGLSSNIRGIKVSGLTTSDTNVIDYVTIASAGNATDFGDVTVARRTLGACASPTRGVAGGGVQTSTDQNVIDYITIATTGNATDFGDLTAATSSLAGCSSETRGLFGGGAIGSTPQDTIEYVTIASTGNATDFGNLTVARRILAACSSKLRGVFSAGRTAAPADSNILDYVTIASTGNATDFGDIIDTSRGLAGCSNGHGGIAA